MRSLVDPAVSLAIGGYRRYLRVFAESPAAGVLSRPSPVRRAGFDLDVAVLAREELADGVVSLVLRRVDGEAVPSWTPGAHLDVLLPSGAQRQYSLCGDPTDRSAFRIAVRLIDPAAGGGGGSAEVHGLAVGDRVQVRGPRNAFWMVAEPSYLFVAAGIGITPILPMVRRAAAEGADWRLVYLGRNRATLPFLDDLAALDPDGTRVVVRTDDEHGVPTPQTVLDLGRRDDETLPAAVYLCGPPALIDATRVLIRPLVPDTRLFSERFSAPPVAGGQEFTVTLASTGARVTVAPDESMLTALRRIAPDVAYSCQQGYCGSCRQRVVGGSIEHRDRLLLEHERADTVLTCVSRGGGDAPLVLDL